MREGIIGDVNWARCEFPNPRDPLSFKQPERPPNWLDWNLWLGPAPDQPYHQNLVHYNRHWFWDFGNGEMGNNWVHIIDIFRWMMGRGLPVRAHAAGSRFGSKDQAQTPNTHRSTFEFADGALLSYDVRNLYSNQGRVIPRRAVCAKSQWFAEFTWDLSGAEGYIHMKHRVERPGAGCDYQVFLGRKDKAEPPMEDLSNLHHYQNFVDAMRARDRDILIAEIEEIHLSGIFCEMANISTRVGRELRFDPATEKIVGDDEASQFLGREYRKPFELPDPV